MERLFPMDALPMDNLSDPLLATQLTIKETNYLLESDLMANLSLLE
jgi:hypothetical protein